MAALGVVVEDRPDLLETLLDLGPDAVEKRIIQIPLAGEVTLSVLNVSPGRLQHHRHLGTGIARSRSVYGRAPFREATSGSSSPTPRRQVEAEAPPESSPLILCTWKTITSSPTS